MEHTEAQAAARIGTQAGTPSASTVPLIADVYGNVAAANMTPWDVNLIVSRIGVPPSSPVGVHVNLMETLKPVARVTLPLAALPFLIEILQSKFDEAVKLGWLEKANLISPGEK